MLSTGEVVTQNSGALKTLDNKTIELNQIEKTTVVFSHLGVKFVI